jgi:iron complex transport system substrate-binding protein
MTSFSRRGALAAVLPTLLLTACSTGPAGSTSTTGSGTSSTGTASTSGTTTAAAFPVTIEHAFGSTTIEKEPTRIATIGWSDQDHLVALGIVPVAPRS